MFRRRVASRQRGEWYVNVRACVDGLGGSRVADPSGYGASAAAYALNYASSATGASSAVNHVWWIDVETANTWSSNQAANAALIQGALTYLKQQGVSDRVIMYMQSRTPGAVVAQGPPPGTVIVAPPPPVSVGIGVGPYYGPYYRRSWY